MPLDEELAGPPLTLQPARPADRVYSIDVLRGFALLGILVLNIDDFGTAEGLHDIPVGTPIDSFQGPHAHLNLSLCCLSGSSSRARCAASSPCSSGPG